MSATSELSEEKYDFLSTYRRQLFCFADSITSLNIIHKAGGCDAGHHEGNEYPLGVSICPFPATLGTTRDWVSN